MNIQNRFVGFCATTVEGEREILGKPADLAARLLLFDDYVFESCKLLEFPQLISIFGFDSVLELVKSRSIRIKCDANLVVVFGETEDLVRKGKTLDMISVIYAPRITKTMLAVAFRIFRRVPLLAANNE